MKILLALILILPFQNAIAFGKRKSSHIDLRSKEEMVFYSKKDMLLSEIGKIAEFQGVLVRENQPLYELRSADLYQFSNEKKISMSVRLCNFYADKIYGDAKKRSLKLERTPALFQTTVGQACTFMLKDSFADASRPYRLAMVGFVHGRLIALTWNLSDKPTDRILEDLQSFWKTIK